MSASSPVDSAELLAPDSTPSTVLSSPSTTLVEFLAALTAVSVEETSLIRLEPEAILDCTSAALSAAAR